MEDVRYEVATMAQKMCERWMHHTDPDVIAATGMFSAIAILLNDKPGTMARAGFKIADVLDQFFNMDGAGDPV